MEVERNELRNHLHALQRLIDAYVDSTAPSPSTELLVPVSVTSSYFDQLWQRPAADKAAKEDLLHRLFAFCHCSLSGEDFLLAGPPLSWRDDLHSENIRWSLSVSFAIVQEWKRSGSNAIATPKGGQQQQLPGGQLTGEDFLMAVFTPRTTSSLVIEDYVDLPLLLSIQAPQSSELALLMSRSFCSAFPQTKWLCFLTTGQDAVHIAGLMKEQRSLSTTTPVVALSVTAITQRALQLFFLRLDEKLLSRYASWLPESATTGGDCGSCELPVEEEAWRKLESMWELDLFASLKTDDCEAPHRLTRRLLFASAVFCDILWLNVYSPFRGIATHYCTSHC